MMMIRLGGILTSSHVDGVELKLEAECRMWMENDDLFGW